MYDWRSIVWEGIKRLIVGNDDIMDKLEAIQLIDQVHFFMDASLYAVIVAWVTKKAYQRLMKGG